MKKTRIGVVGCGDISRIYFENMTGLFKDNIEIAGICDLVPAKAEAAKEKYGIQRIYKDMHELFADPTVDIVLNITRPYEHFDVSLAAIAAGKHVYSEKPLGATLEEGTKLVEAANAKGVRIGGAPDTFLGAGIQTCRKLIDDGFIGIPVGATAFMVGGGHETWHPDPEFYYKRGGGPMLDMGPYYITALVNLLGGVDSVTGMCKISYPTRTVTSEPHKGHVITVDVPTYTMGLMQFANGAIGSIFTTFDATRAQLPFIEIYGSEGTLSVPDPNGFDGPVSLYRHETRAFTEMPLLFDYAGNPRSLGLVDMADALQAGRKARTSSDLTYHVLEIMTAIEKSGQTGERVAIKSKTERPPLREKLVLLKQ